MRRYVFAQNMQALRLAPSRPHNGNGANLFLEWTHFKGDTVRRKASSSSCTLLYARTASGEPGRMCSAGSKHMPLRRAMGVDLRLKRTIESVGFAEID